MCQVSGLSRSFKNESEFLIVSKAKAILSLHGEFDQLKQINLIAFAIWTEVKVNRTFGKIDRNPKAVLEVFGSIL